jgi:hypothetical protein
MKTEFIAEEDLKRSEFIYSFLKYKKDRPIVIESSSLPKTIVRFLHNLKDIPDDVLACIDSWKTLENQDFQFRKIWTPTPIPDLPLKMYVNTWITNAESLAGKFEQEILPKSFFVKHISSSEYEFDI